MLFWLSAAQIAAKVDRLRVAEEKLLALAPSFGKGASGGSYQIDVLDTRIPSSVVPLISHDSDQVKLEKEDKDHYVIHGVRVTSSEEEDEANKSATPLILLHGYMNGASYFFRNLAGLSHAFSSVYSLDLLGWGLSSRPKFQLLKQASEEDRIRTAEDFFVESLEAWRCAQGIPKMILAGHSMGGYISVAYCERYPERVEKLILLSPAGVPADASASVERIAQFRKRSLFFRALSTTWYYLYEWNHTVGGVLRSLPERRAAKMSSGYVERRLPAISDPHEQQVLSEYLLANNLLPGSGEYCVHSFLTSTLNGRKATELRIPNLRVPSVSFLYGSRDWMDIDGGLRAQARCSTAAASQQAPNVSVYRVSDAGHLLMLDNYEGMNAGLIQAAGLEPTSEHRADLVSPTQDHYRAVSLPSAEEIVRGNTIEPTVGQAVEVATS